MRAKKSMAAAGLRMMQARQPDQRKVRELSQKGIVIAPPGRAKSLLSRAQPAGWLPSFSSLASCISATGKKLHGSSILAPRAGGGLGVGPGPRRAARRRFAAATRADPDAGGAAAAAAGQTRRDGRPRREEQRLGARPSCAPLTPPARTRRLATALGREAPASPHSFRALPSRPHLSRAVPNHLKSCHSCRRSSPP